MKSFKYTGQKVSKLILGIRKSGYKICESKELYCPSMLRKLQQIVDEYHSIIIINRLKAGTTVMIPDTIELDYKKLFLVPDPTWNEVTIEQQIAKRVLDSISRSGISNKDLISSLEKDASGAPDQEEEIDPSSLTILEQISESIPSN